VNSVNSVSNPIFLAGPTAVGKSEIALALAKKIGGEIISVDSMQVYRGLDIGTAKPSAEEQKRVRHHVIDAAELTEPFDAAKFVSLAQRAVAEIQSRDHMPIFCGGTGLYFKAYLDGLGDAPPSDAKLRAELEKTSLEDLLHELKQRDAETYEKIDRNNPRRVIRAVEAIRLTGKKFSEQRARWDEATDEPNQPAAGSRGRSPHQIIGLSRTSEDLHARINTRVDSIFRHGLVAETKQLLNRGLAQNKTAMQAIGYRQVVEHLRGERSLDDTIELVKIKTRQFAKRQMTWFRRQLNLDWIELAPADDTGAVIQQIMDRPRI
jgi:tRNA dimethylallyltransferase